MTDSFEQRVLWRLVAPLAVACIVAAGGSIFSVYRLQVAVQQLRETQQSLAEVDWVNQKFKFTKYRLSLVEGKVDANATRINRNSRAIDAIKNEMGFRRGS